MKTAVVLVLRGLRHYLSYAIPDGISDLSPGATVQVPIGHSHAKGIVMGFSKENTAGLKEIFSVEKDHPLISDEFLKMMDWMQWYYGISPYLAYQTVMGNKKIRPISGLVASSSEEQGPILTKEQSSVLHSISSLLGNYHQVLLHGITGSGKTEIYLQLAMKVKSLNQQVILLVPEISLTPQLTSLFKQRLGSDVGLLHSHQTPKQKEIEWSKILLGYSKVIIGPRSAIFSPVKKLGLVIIDEEHDGSYKQENNPRYWTHELAKFRCQYHQAVLLLGSATPSLESYYHCQDKGHIFSLSKRATGQLLPKVTILDMKEAYLNGAKGILSDEMIEQVTKRLAKKEKSLILLNRRGFSTYIFCLKCKKIVSCPGCKLGYTYHQDQYLRCHRCQTSLAFQGRCPGCEGHKLVMSGLGIQRLESELKLRFPFANILRLDKDTAGSVVKIEDTLQEFRKKGDILIGTQMIAKGHDISEITFVGVLGIDTTLHLPDYTASEKAFQLLVQVAGRAGRGDKLGEVMIQTFDSEHPAIVYAASHDYSGFSQQEKCFRQELYYPPFCELIHLIWSSQNKKELEMQAELDMSFLRSLQTETLLVLGPKPAPIEMIKGFHRKDALLKYQLKDFLTLKSKLDLLETPSKKVKRIIDYSPKQLL